MIASKSLAVVRDRDSQSKCFYSIFFPSLKKYFCIPWKLSPPQRPVCLVGRLGRKKKKARWRRWEERRKGAGLFRSSHRPSRAFCFSIIAIFIGIPNGSLCGGERAWKRSRKTCLNDGSMVTTLVAICNTRFCHFHPFFFTKHAKYSKIHNYISWLRWLNTVFLELLLISPYPEEICGQ